MPFEEIDKRIQEAADNHHPAYDEKAWDKMESKLNKHLPQRKDKRRAALLLLLLFITAGGAGYYLLTRTGEKSASTVNNKIPEQKTVDPNNNPSTTNLQKDQFSNELSQDENEKKRETPSTTLLLTSRHKNRSELVSVIPPFKSNNGENLFQDANNLNKPKIQTNPDQSPTINPDPSTNKSNNITSILPDTKKEEELKAAEKEKSAPELIANPAQKNAGQVQIQESKTKKEKIRKGNGLFLSLSAGPDVGAVELENVGRLRLAGGAGIGYKFSDRLSLQTGFYVTRKIYSASANDYYAPDWWWQYYPNLQSVDADCKVYEIPLLVNYNFTKNKRSNWFGTVGISSYLMKKEDYDYHYKTASGQPATRNWVYNNANKHYFNVITVAGGYERNINKNFSLSFSPYVKVPWKGVGFGKVKLNSAGIFVSANFKPFVKK